MDELYALADDRELVLMEEALKTRYFPAFDHLKLMLESGLVGEVKDIHASFSHVFDELEYRCLPGQLLRYGILYCLPAISFLGTEYLDAQFVCSLFENDFCVWTKCNLLYSGTIRHVEGGPRH